MPPPNDTAATALTISSFPYNINTDPTGGSTGSEAPSCYGGDLQTPLWYKYTGDGTVKAIGISFDPSNSANEYWPGLAIYTGTPGSLTQITQACWLWDDTPDTPRLVQFGIESGTTYYFVFWNDFFSPGALSNLVAEFTAAADDDWISGDFLISNDTYQFPTTIISKTDGTIKQQRAFPAFEQAAMLPDGTILVASVNASYFTDSFKLYNPSLALQATITSIIVANQYEFNGVATDGTDFYVVCGVFSGAGANTAKLHKISSTGVVDPTSWTLPAPAGSMSAMAVHDGIVYWNTESLTGDNDKTLHRYSLTTGALSALVTLGANEKFGRDLEVTSDGLSILANHVTALGVYSVKKYNLSTGALQTTYTLDAFEPTAGGTPRFRIDPTGQTTFVSMTSTAYNGLTGTMSFQRFNIASGAETEQFNVSFRKDNDPDQTPIFAISQSCPLLILASATPPIAVNVGYSGVYQIVPDKRNDTLYITQDPVVTADFPIEEPLFRTGFVGDQ